MDEIRLNLTSGAEALEKQARELQQQAEQLVQGKQELSARLTRVLGQMGYPPPVPTPFVTERALETVVRDLDAHPAASDLSQAIESRKTEMHHLHEDSYRFLEALKTSLIQDTSFLSRIERFLRRIDGTIDQAKLLIDVPDVSPKLQQDMRRFERFLSEDWVKEEYRSIVVIHVDNDSQTTILQVGIARHGPVYITIPGILRPNDVALNSMRELFKRLEPFRDGADPMAVIDGAYQELNYSELFVKSRVYRAPSGNTSRFLKNSVETARRERLAQDNTLIVNSAPYTLEQYRRVFPGDTRGQHWAAWSNEARLWHGSISPTGFDTVPNASRDAFLGALAGAENVVVIVAHSDGESLFMPEPPPHGTRITANDLVAHQKEIAAKAPFVYLFACKGGRLENVRNFASTLLECGASGVVASQTIQGSAEGRTLLERLLREGRGKPPIEDFFKQTRELRWFDMEVFLA